MPAPQAPVISEEEIQKQITHHNHQDSE
jgi:hypothetical protein